LILESTHLHGQGTTTLFTALNALDGQSPASASKPGARAARRGALWLAEDVLQRSAPTRELLRPGRR
jgi:hypothetical protein